MYSALYVPCLCCDFLESSDGRRDDRTETSCSLRGSHTFRLPNSKKIEKVKGEKDCKYFKTVVLASQGKTGLWDHRVGVAVSTMSWDCVGVAVSTVSHGIVLVWLYPQQVLVHRVGVAVSTVSLGPSFWCGCTHNKSWDRDGVAVHHRVGVVVPTVSLGSSCSVAVLTICYGLIVLVWLYPQ